VITVLFCDLVGFTALSEGADPEDVDRMLSRYAATARAQIELFGGVVEKFIGDAVVGVFGVPSAHEDDAERAVRAALTIVAEAGSLRLRIGVNTGESFVRFDVTPGSGDRFLAGDTINTASRIQSVAPEMGVAVGFATHEATKRRFDYQELPPAQLKGKTEPVRVFRALMPRPMPAASSTRADAAAGTSTFVGREAQLATVVGLLEASIATGSTRIATVIGEPGQGKSRLVAELRAHAGAHERRLTWRQGRCLPYGSGITFWALGEIVKAQAGILESDPTIVATEKLDRSLPENAERAWLRDRLLPLVGVESGSKASRDEQFSAWRQYLTLLASDRPTVLVFEDLHWADDAMVSFLEDLASRTPDVPLFVLGTARPELLHRRPDFPGPRSFSTRLVLTELAPDEAGRLASSLLDGVDLAPDLRQPLVDRAAGNPLFIEEFVRLLIDRDLLVRGGDAYRLRDGATMPVPDSIHAVLAARLDTLPRDWKALLSDAAVVGKVFWDGAVAALGGRDRATTTDILGQLAERGTIRRADATAMADEAEYAFSHVLARDVAYGAMPRSDRSRKHAATARWIEGKVGDRVEDLADVLAYHYSTALDLARASEQWDRVPELEAAAFRFLSLAGERALDLDAAASLGFLERAVAMAPPGHPRRAEALARFGRAAPYARRHQDAVDALQEAIDLFQAAGDIRSAARATMALSLPLGRLGSSATWERSSDALRMLEPLEPSTDHVAVMTDVAVQHALLGHYGEAIEQAQAAIKLGERLGLPRSAKALGFLGLAEAESGDPRGLDHQREAVALAIATGAGREVGSLANNLGVSLWNYSGPAEAARVIREGADYSAARGLDEMAVSLRCGELDARVDLGELDVVLQAVSELLPTLRDIHDVFNIGTLRAAQARVLMIRGDPADAAEWIGEFEASIRSVGNPDFFACYTPAAGIRLLLGEPAKALALLEALESSVDVETSPNFFHYLPAMARIAVEIEARALAQRLIERPKPAYPLSADAWIAASAVLLEAAGDLAAAEPGYADAAERWERFGVVPEIGYALLGRARALVALGRASDAAPVAERAREIFRGLGAIATADEASALVAATNPAQPPANLRAG